MTRTLLADRFKLNFHEILKESPGYALVVAKNGPKLQEGDGTGRGGTGGNAQGITGYNASLATLANQLTRKLGQRVEDKTGLTGRYDFRLTFGTDDSDTSSPSIFTALPEQLGLKLEPQNVPTRYLVIDHAEKPRGN